MLKDRLEASSLPCQELPLPAPSWLEEESKSSTVRQLDLQVARPKLGSLRDVLQLQLQLLQGQLLLRGRSVPVRRHGMKVPGRNVALQEKGGPLWPVDIFAQPAVLRRGVCCE